MKTTRQLPVDLNEEEIADRGRAMAKSVSEKAGLQEEKKSATADINAKIKACGEVIRKLSEIISGGKEDREVSCEVKKDFDSNTVTVVRDDTGEVVEERPLTVDERQENMFPHRDPKAPKKGKGKPLTGDDNHPGDKA